MKRNRKTIALAVILLFVFASCESGNAGESDDDTDKPGTTGNPEAPGDQKKTDDPTTPTDPKTPADPEPPSSSPIGWGASLNVSKPATPVRLIFIHHSCGNYWLANEGGDYNGGLGNALNDNNYYVSDTYYGWNAAPEDGLGDRTNTENWPDWFNETKMPYVYGSSSHSTWDGNDLAEPAGENAVIMFKSCYPLSEVGTSIDDEKTVYTGLLTYFAAHQDKLFVLVTPPGETTVGSAALTKDLCDWLVNRETGWLKGYARKNVLVYDFYCTLSETGSRHTVSGGVESHVWDAAYDGTSPYHDGDDHPNATGNKKATGDFIPLLNAAYNYWK